MNGTKIRDFGEEVLAILERYHGDTERILRENRNLAYLRAFAPLRENLLEWIDVREGAEILQLGADFGAVTGLLAKKAGHLTVLSAENASRKAAEFRYGELDHVTFTDRVEEGAVYDCVVALGPEAFDALAGMKDSRNENSGDENRRNGNNRNGNSGDENRREEDAVRKTDARALLEQAKRLVKEGGLLIAAAENTYGLKVLAGAERENISFTKEQMTATLPDAAFYYPMPDWRFAVEIFSDRYLPKQGDLAGTRMIYDYPEYLPMNVGAEFEKTVEDGKFPDFANSYLAVWQKTRAGESPVNAASDREIPAYIKYNSTREAAYQIKTEIYERPERNVVKTALCPEGRDHITSFAEKYRLLSEQNAELHYAKPEIIADGMSARFPYLEGETLSEIITEKIGNALGEGNADGADAQGDLSAVFDIIRSYAADIFRVVPEKTGPFRLTDSFLNVFGASGELFDPFERTNAEGKENPHRTREELEALLADESWAASNIDALFANMIRTKDGMYALDYEWVFLFPVPAGFVKYRILSYCKQMLQGFFSGMTEEEFLGHFPEFVRTEPELLDLYRKMERGFQAHVHSADQYDLQEKYIVPTRTIRDLAQVHHERDELKERVEQLKAELSAKDTELKKVREVQRLTNNHVTNLTAIIDALRHENGEMAKTLAYLNRHEALIFKGKRKLGKAFNRLYPQGSAGRKRLGYIKRGILNPAEGIRLLTTEEGKNLVKGDFEIGAEYRTYGKIRLPYYENPTVSIVIPVYNQIHYTYLCLQSILEHTTDVTYEVIIADDVSKDATEHLTEFVDNVVICRNATNQGFLRNCNNAAKSARGKYVMFLNNDTQVTEGWLSSLVNLIESDDSIGMVGSKLVYPDGRLQEAGGIIWSDGSGWNYGRLDNPDKPEYNYVKDVDYISGAAILLSTALWKEIGGFDDRFAPAYCEDSDLAFEVRRHGKRVVYQPLSKVIHFEGVSNGTDVNGTGLKRYQVENSRKLKEKWKDVFAHQCENTGNPDPFRARERSMGKPMILVVDHYVPTYDRDAGSKTTFQYLKMFLQEGYQVKFLGDNFLHEEPYTTALEQMGIEVLYGAEYETGIWDWLEKHQNDIAVAYLNRPHIATKYVDFIAEHTNISMIFYGHDLHFMRLYREYELSGDVKKRTESEYWKSVEFTLMHKVAISYYPSQVEIDAIHAQDPEIPARAITAYVYDEFKEKLNLDFEKREGLLFVGGFAHPPNADAVLWFMDHVWPEIHEALPEVKFHIVGSKATDEIKALHDPENGVIVEGFVSEERLGELYETTRIDVVPLRYGAGVKGKVVEALYNGMPIITTSVGAEGIPEVETVLRVEDDPEAFADAVVKLYQDPEALARMAQGTQDYVKKNFSTEAAWSVIEEDFRIAGAKTPKA